MHSMLFYDWTLKSKKDMDYIAVGEGGDDNARTVLLFLVIVTCRKFAAAGH